MGALPWPPKIYVSSFTPPPPLGPRPRFVNAIVNPKIQYLPTMADAIDSGYLSKKKTTTTTIIPFSITQVTSSLRTLLQHPQPVDAAVRLGGGPALGGAA